MSYTAFELAEGDALSDVANLARHAARANGGFSSETIPSLAAVERWITTSYAWICGLLRRAGLSDAQTDTSVVGILQELNVYDVVVKIELSLPAEMSTGEPNERFRAFVDRRAELLEALKDGTLAGLGALGYNAGIRSPIGTGQSLSRKRVMEDDTDANQHRVRTEQFDYPGVNTNATLADSNDWVPT